ncbi:hypothetical protein [Kiloniella laminariae]|uniref:hypothetical protein n=1 Tax=Kiloniella laminariae TaxID=454162 RepID=UPI0003687187|nr:hypothetical protein [Kiloniella laminariae]
MAHQNMTASTIGSRALATALDAVSAMGQTGHLIIPETPTLAMLKAGSLIGGLSEETVRKIFVSMVEAEQ